MFFRTKDFSLISLTIDCWGRIWFYFGFGEQGKQLTTFSSKCLWNSDDEKYPFLVANVISYLYFYFHYNMWCAPDVYSSASGNSRYYYLYLHIDWALSIALQLSLLYCISSRKAYFLMSLPPMIYQLQNDVLRHIYDATFDIVRFIMKLFQGNKQCTMMLECLMHEVDNQSINQISIAPSVSSAKTGSVERKPNWCSAAKPMKQFPNINNKPRA